MFKKIVIAIFLVTIGYRVYVNHSVEESNVKHTAQPLPVVAFEQETSSFKCDGRQYCSQMRSREEAEFFLRNCPNTKMDGDNDGIPCERQF